MADGSGEHPSEDELIAFAARVLGDTNSSLVEPEALRETVRQAHELWLMLYRIDRGFDQQP